MEPTRRSGRGARVLALVRMTRPDHLVLVAGVHLVGVGMAIARGATADPSRVVTGLVAVLVVAVGIHVANEFADRDTDALTTRTRFSGGSGATVDTDLSASVVDRATAAVLAGSVLAVAFSAAAASMGALTWWFVVVLGVAAVLGWAYSVPPIALVRRGWGEVDNAVLGGGLLPLSGVATIVAPTAADVLAVVPATLVVFANLLATQWPDRWADASVGKWTLATSWSTARLRGAHGLALVAAVALPWVLPRAVVPVPVAWGATAAAPFAVWSVLTFTRDDRPLPTVATMLVLVVGTGVAWWLVALGVVEVGSGPAGT